MSGSLLKCDGRGTWALAVLVHYGLFARSWDQIWRFYRPIVNGVMVSVSSGSQGKRVGRVIRQRAKGSGRLERALIKTMLEVGYAFK